MMIIGEAISESDLSLKFWLKQKTLLVKNKLLIIFFLITSCSTSKQANLSSTLNFDWLIGEWERTNEEPGKTTFEKWKKINEAEYHGNSYTLKNRDTSWQENVSLKKSQMYWIYDVTQKGETKSTPFKITSLVKERLHL